MEWAYPYLRDHLSHLRLKKDPMALAFENALAEFDEKSHRRYPDETPARAVTTPEELAAAIIAGTEANRSTPPEAARRFRTAVDRGLLTGPLCPMCGGPVYFVEDSAQGGGDGSKR